jgi:hypothetical protein
LVKIIDVILLFALCNSARNLVDLFHGNFFLIVDVVNGMLSVEDRHFGPGIFKEVIENNCVQRQELSKTLGRTSRVNSVQASREKYIGAHSPEMIGLLSLSAKPIQQ